MAITSTLVESATTTAIFSATGEQAITTIMFCNTDDMQDAAFDVYVVGNGNVVGASTQVLNNIQLPGGETFVMDAEKLILSNGDVIYAQASVDSIISASVSSVGL
jgi:hypothetical protein